MNQNNSSVINVNNLSSKAPVVRCDFDIENFPFLDGVVPYYVYVLGLLESAIM